MFGFHKGGKIKGKGSGTSDDVPLVVKNGSYIVPADSADKIGIHASNGEHSIPPEQLADIGEMVLNAVKNVTHNEVPDQNGKGLGLYFANGGRVEWDRTRKVISDVENAYNSESIGRKIGTATTMTPRLAYGVTRDLGDRIGNNLKEMGRQASDNISYAWEGVKDFAGDVYDGATGQDTSAQRQAAKQAAATPAVAATAQPKPQANAAVSNGSNQAQQQVQAQQKPMGFGLKVALDALPTPYSGGLAARMVDRAHEIVNNKQLPTVTYGVSNDTGRLKTGDSDGIPDNLPKDSRGVSFAPAGFQPGIGYGKSLAEKFDAQKPFVSAPQDGLSEEQQKALKAASTPHKGAQNGQLTANQINAMRGIIGDNEKSRLSMQQHADNLNQKNIDNAVQLQRDELMRNAALQRDALNNRYADARQLRQDAINQGQFDQRLAWEKEKAAPQLAAQGFNAEQAKRINSLQDAYSRATDENTRLGIASRISGLSGNVSGKQSLSDNISKISVPVYDDTGLQVGSRDDLIDIRTGRSILVGSNGGIPSAAIAYLISNPESASEFEGKYGKGSSKPFLK